MCLLCAESRRGRYSFGLYTERTLGSTAQKSAIAMQREKFVIAKFDLLRKDVEANPGIKGAHLASIRIPEITCLLNKIIMVLVFTNTLQLHTTTPLLISIISDKHGKKLLLLDPTTHLTQLCSSSFRRHVKRHKNWSTWRRKATEEEKKEHLQTKKSASYFVYLRFGKAKKNKAAVNSL